MKRKLIVIGVTVLIAVLTYLQFESTTLKEYFDNNGFDYNNIDEITVLQSGFNWNKQESVRIELVGNQAISYLMTIIDIPIKKRRSPFRKRDDYWNPENHVSTISISARSNNDSIRLVIFNSEDGQIGIRLFKDKLLDEELYFINFADFLYDK